MEIPELRNKLIGIKNSIDGFKSRLENFEEWIDELVDKNWMLIPKSARMHWKMVSSYITGGI